MPKYSNWIQWEDLILFSYYRTMETDNGKGSQMGDVPKSKLNSPEDNNRATTTTVSSILTIDGIDASSKSIF